MNAPVDLQQLKVERPAAAEPRPARSLLSRYVIPGGIAAGFIVLLAVASKDRLATRRTVRTVPVVVTRADVRQASAPLFQAPGWVEPRPTPIMVSFLTSGVIEEICVVEGQEVTRGQLLARLHQADGQLVLQESEAELRLRAAEVVAAESAKGAAEKRFQNPLHLTTSLAEAQSQLAKVERELTSLPNLAAGAQSRLDFARSNAERKRQAVDVIAGRIIEQAETDLRAAEAELKELIGREPGLKQEAGKLRERVDGLSQQLDLLVDEERALNDANAQLDAARARYDFAHVAMERAQLQLDRTKVTSPVDGRVLQLLAAPGMLVGGTSAEGNRTAEVVSLYQPNQLQVRADVRLEDVGTVEVGQPVRIETAVARQPLTGTVLQITSTANVQKNTLEVKVSIDAPPPALRPEMLVSTTFLTPAGTAPGAGAAVARERILIPHVLVRREGEAAYVWLVNDGETAAKRTINLGPRVDDQMIQVVEGLTPTDKLIDSPPSDLEDGELVTPSEE